MRADRRLYLDRSQSRLVEEADTACAWLLAAKGQEIPAAEVKRLGLVLHDGRVQQGHPEAKPLAYALPVTESVTRWTPAVEMTPAPEPDAPAPVMPPESRRRRRK